jgi:hypothetical protein
MTQRDETTTRRRFLKWSAAAAAALPVAGSLLRPEPAIAGDAKHLDEADPAAKALGYTEDTSTVDATKFPQHQPSQDCGGCRYFQGKAGSEWGPCTLFTGKGSVHSMGWCAAYASK